MTPVEKKVAHALLQLAADRFSRRICNDLDLVALGVTPEESFEFRKAMTAAGDYPDSPVSPDNHIVMDWLVLSYLADRVKADP